MRRPIVIRRAPVRDAYTATKRPTRRYSMRRVAQALKGLKPPHSDSTAMQRLRLSFPEVVLRHFKLSRPRLEYFRREERIRPKEEIIQNTFFIVSPVPGLIATLIVGIITLIIESMDGLDPNNIEKNKKVLEEQERAKQLKNLIKLIKGSNKDADEISADISNAVLFLNSSRVEEGSPTYKAIGLLQDILTDAFSDKNVNANVIFDKVVDGVCKTFKDDPKSFSGLSHSNLHGALDFVLDHFKSITLDVSKAQPASEPMSTTNILQSLTHEGSADRFALRIEEIRSGTTNFRRDYQQHKGEGLYGKDYFDFLLYNQNPFYARFLLNRNVPEKKPLAIDFLNLDSQNDNNANKI